MRPTSHSYSSIQTQMITNTIIINTNQISNLLTVIFEFGMSTPKKHTFLSKLNEVFLKLDLFSNPQLLKYRGQGAHQTYAGSTASIIIVVFFIVIFFNFCKQTINRSTIKNTTGLKPSLGSSFNTNQSNSAFMFAVGLEGVDLTAQKKFFEIFMTSKVYKNGVFNASQDVQLSPCLPQQWEGINEEFKKIYSKLNFKQWLCPPKDYNFIFKGKFTSEEYRYSKLVVRRCRSQTSKCASNSELIDLLLKQKTFKLSVYFANPIIDASQKQYLDYVLQDSNYFEFTDMIGVSSHIFFSEYEVNTDNSIYPEPHSDLTTEKGLTLNQRPVVSNFEVINTDEFVRIQLRKSDLIQQYNRSYTRFDATFAYLGGLFGMMLLLFYGLRAFNEYAFQFEIGSKLFVYNDKQNSEFDSDKFHILRFPIYLFYCIATFLYGPAENWQCFAFYRSVDKCRDEVKQQTDVCFLIKRVIYLEKAIELFCKDKLDNIKLHHRWTIDEARQKREFYDNHRRVQHLIITSEKKAANRYNLSQEKIVPNGGNIIFINKQLERQDPQKMQHIPSPKYNKQNYQANLQVNEVLNLENSTQMHDVQENNYELPHLNAEIVSEREPFEPRRKKEKLKNLIKCSKQMGKPKPQSKQRSNQSLKDLIQMQNKENVTILPFNSNQNKYKIIMSREQQKKSIR